MRFCNGVDEKFQHHCVNPFVIASQSTNKLQKFPEKLTIQLILHEAICNESFVVFPKRKITEIFLIKNRRIN